jgi:hypothetical protein
LTAGPVELVQGSLPLTHSCAPKTPKGSRRAVQNSMRSLLGRSSCMTTHWQLRAVSLSLRHRHRCLLREGSAAVLRSSRLARSATSRSSSSLHCLGLPWRSMELQQQQLEAADSLPQLSQSWEHTTNTVVEEALSPAFPVVYCSQ